MIRSRSLCCRRAVARAVVAALLLLVTVPSARASLPAEESRKLTETLRAVAERGHADGEAAARQLLEAPTTGRADLVEFFTLYFQRDPLTRPLSSFLLGSALGASDVAARPRLQEALAEAVVDQIASVMARDLPDRLGPALEENAVSFEHLGASMELLGQIAYRGDGLSPASRSQHYARLRGLVATHPSVLRKDVTIDMRAQPKLAAIRARLYKNLQDLKVPFDRAGFIADTGFWGPYAELVRTHGLIVLDNNGFDARQLQAIQDLLALIPSELHRTAHISQNELLGNGARYDLEVSFAGSPGVNVFSTPIDGPKQNQFPPDVAPVRVPLFCSALQHELNHMVDWFTIRVDPALAERRDALIEQAGIQPLRYLRSTLSTGYFTQHPQELFASIANQYFADAGRTLQLALVRFDAGRPEPLDQLLFFTEVYARRGGETLFFRQDEACHYAATTVPIGRDAKGRIDRLRFEGTEYRFERDARGDVRRRSERRLAPLDSDPNDHSR